METEAIVNGRAIPGELSTVVAGGTGAPRWVRSPCRGEELRHEPSLGAGDRIQVSLRFGSPSYESGWTILVDEDATNEETISLAGRALTPRIDCAALGALEGAGVLVLFACDGARADVRSRIVVFTEGATATAPVHVPLGRYLYRFGTAACHVAFGTAEAVRAGEDGTWTLALRAQWLTPSTGEGITVDEVEGVSLEALPAQLRFVQANAERILAPHEGRWR